MESPLPDLPPREQLAELENRYAEYLMEEMDVRILAQLWEQIKALRRQLGIYSPGE